MNRLYNELVAGHVEFKDNGEIVRHPPSCLVLRAARAVKQVAEINEANRHIIINMQNTIQQLHETNNELQRQLSALQEVQSSRVQSDSVQPSDGHRAGTENVRDGEGQASTVGREDGQPGEGDSDSQGSGTTESETIGTGTN